MGLAQLKSLVTAEDYLNSEREAATERHEYWDGEIYAMAGETFEHGTISVNLVGELRQQLKGKPCWTFTKDMKVRSGSDIDLHKWLKGFFSYPDVFVACGELKTHDKYRDIILNPTVIIEVLSAATEAFDRGKKFRRYRENLPTLMDYILVSQTEMLIDSYQRGENGKWILTSVSGKDAVLHLDSIGCKLELSEVYDRIDFSNITESAENEQMSDALVTSEPVD